MPPASAPPPPPVVPPAFPAAASPATPPIVPPVDPPVVIAPPVTRRQARLNRRREQRRRVGLLGGIAIAVVAIIVVATLAFGVHKVVTHNNGTTRTQSTVLLQIEGPGSTAAASILLAQHPGVEVMIPSRVMTDVCGYGSQNFGDVLALPNGVTASRQALSAMLNGVTVDGSWVLSPAQLAKLIDTVGGVTVAVDVNVLRHVAHGRTQVLIPAGPNRKLNGTQAVEFALYNTSSTADAAAEEARLQLVVDAMVQALPRQSSEVAADLRLLGVGGTSTLGSARLTTLLMGLAAEDRSANGVLPTDLPVTPVDAGGGAPSYRVLGSGVDQLVSEKLSNSVPADANKAHQSVELLNGVGTPGLVLTACPRLEARGFTYAGSGNAATFNNPKSSVEIKSDSDADISVGDEVARALGLPTGDVVRTTDDETVADVIVVLGNDYHG
jgi:hypothetical protein